MSNDHLPEPLRSVLNNIDRNYAEAHAGLRETMAILERAPAPKDMAAMKRAVLGSEPAENTRIVLEKCPFPDCNPLYLWNAYHEGREDDLTTTGATPLLALATFLSQLDDAS